MYHQRCSIASLSQIANISQEVDYNPSHNVEDCTNLVKCLGSKDIKRRSNQFNFNRTIIISSSFSFPHCFLQDRAVVTFFMKQFQQRNQIKIRKCGMSRTKTLMWRTPSNWKHFISISARTFKGWGVILLLIFFTSASFTSSDIAGTTLAT